MLNGIVIGVLLAITFVLSFIKLPRSVRRWLAKHDLLTDLVAGLLIWGIIAKVSTTVFGVISAVIAELVLASGLHLYKHHADKIDDKLS